MGGSLMEQEWVLTALSIIGSWYNIQKRSSCWLIWSLANVGWIISFSLKEMYPQATLFIVYLCISLYGWAKWSDNNSKKIELELPQFKLHKK
jgi:nicotinamide riboside transporter PnuC